MTVIETNKAKVFSCLLIGTNGSPSTGKTVNVSIQRSSDNLWWNGTGSTWGAKFNNAMTEQGTTGLYSYTFSAVGVGATENTFTILYQETTTPAYGVEDVESKLLFGHALATYNKLPTATYIMGSAIATEESTNITNIVNKLPPAGQTILGTTLNTIDGKEIYDDTKQIFDNAMSPVKPTIDSLADKIMNKDGSQTFSKATDSLEATRDTIDNNTSPEYPGTVTAGLSSKSTFQTNLVGGDNYWNDMQILMLTGSNAGQTRRILAFADTNGVVTVSADFFANVATNDTFVVLPIFTSAGSTLTESGIRDAVWLKTGLGALAEGTAGRELTEIRVDTGDSIATGIQNRLPATLVSNRMRSNVEAIDNIDFPTLQKTSIRTEVGTVFNTAIPGSPTADSVYERVKTLDDNYTSTRAAYLDRLDQTLTTVISSIKGSPARTIQDIYFLISDPSTGVAPDVQAIFDKLPSKNYLRGSNFATGRFDTDDIYDLLQQQLAGYEVAQPYGSPQLNSLIDRIIRMDGRVDQSLSNVITSITGTPAYTLSQIYSVVNSIQNNVFFSCTVLENYQRPTTLPITIRITAQIYDGTGRPEDPDGDLIEMRLIGLTSGTLLPWASMTKDVMGVYFIDFQIENTDVLEYWQFEFKYLELTVSKLHIRPSQLSEYASDINEIQSDVNAIYNKVDAGTLPATIPAQIEAARIDIVDRVDTAESNILDRVDTAETNITTDLLEIQSSIEISLGYANPLSKNTGFGKLTTPTDDLPIGSTELTVFNGGLGFKTTGGLIVINPGETDEEYITYSSMSELGVMTLVTPTTLLHEHWATIRDVTNFDFYLSLRKLDGEGNVILSDPITYNVYDQFGTLETSGIMIQLPLTSSYRAMVEYTSETHVGTRRVELTLTESGKSRVYSFLFDLLDRPASDNQVSNIGGTSLLGDFIIDQDGWYDDYGILHRWEDIYEGPIHDQAGNRLDDVVITAYATDALGTIIWQPNPPFQTISGPLGLWYGSLDAGKYTFVFVKSGLKFQDIVRTIG